jgi:hypothetical protein
MMTQTLVVVGLTVLLGCLPMRAQGQKEEGDVTFGIGGGLTIPLNPTARFAGVSGSFVVGGGLNFGEHSSVVGQYMWNGLPPSVGALAQLNGISARSSLHSITADYEFRMRGRKTFGYYAIIGGGWYDRHSGISQSTFVPTGTVCVPIWNWYGVTCSNGYVNTVGVSSGTSSFGANGGVGITIRVANSPVRFFMESRYIYAASRIISTQAAPVIFGVVFQ